jgi:hypothetical protein
MKHVFVVMLIAVAVCGAGCMGARSSEPQPTSVPAAVSTTSSSTDSASSTTSSSAEPESNTFTYTGDASSTFSFSYPTSVKLQTAGAQQSDVVAAFDLGAAFVPSSTVQAVPTAQLRVLVLDPADPRLKECYFSEQGWAPTSTGSAVEMGGGHMTLNGRDVCFYPDNASSADNGMDYLYSYAVDSGSRVVVFDFVVHAPDCTAFAQPDVDCTEFDESRDTAPFQPIVETFRGQPSTTNPLQFEDVSIESSSTDSEIDVMYPHLINNPAAEAFNALIDERVKAGVKDFQDLVSGGVDDASDTEPWTYDMNYEITYRDDHRFTVLLSGSEYTGGAHPNEDYLAISYDVDANKEITLADLFKSKVNYLKEISSLAIADLNKQNAADEFTDSDWITEGAGPDPENYQDFYLTKNALGVVFAPYQVASYAAGQQGVEIPYSKLKDLLP